jgi:hypothetical protein
MQLFFMDSCPILAVAAVSPAFISGMKGPPSPEPRGGKRSFGLHGRIVIYSTALRKNLLRTRKNMKTLFGFPERTFSD